MRTAWKPGRPKVRWMDAEQGESWQAAVPWDSGLGGGSPSRARISAVDGRLGAQRTVEVKGAKEMLYVNSPLVMVIPVSLRIVFATHIHHDVTRSQFFGVPGPHNLCIL